MNTPNKITVARILLIPIYMFLFIYGHIYSAIVVFVIASLTDSLDGYIARRNKQVTTFGKLMDPIADKMLICAALVCFLCDERITVINEWVAIIVLLREFIVTGIRLLAAGEGNVIAASKWGKAKTISQIIAVTAVMIDTIDGVSLTVKQVNIPLVLVVIMVVLTLYSGVDYILKNRDIIRFK